ncbi:diguanylate cyclase [Aliiglaciecola sp. CAU 1673]|uniref:diguanylate cyclase domain-containing protein n=1 Tax=Aliiglaciecola sp. CAU 1673 TaxID=3032595 RepID=UPI0023DB90D7|nr:diguanylate cyclase [Aliiglaciecola sp. CAU 1673]MDF2177731.1 diguanylate cyclase [Aliiglaciecola sp. CAU 1673]
MAKLSQKLYVRVAIAIALVTISISVITAPAIYWFSLSKQRQVNTVIVDQLAASAEKTSAIAAYLKDEELAQEIINGLVSNNLVSGAGITITNAGTIESGQHQTASHAITVPLTHPFMNEEVVGTLRVSPNDSFIQAQARNIAMQNVGSLLLLSFITASCVALFVHRRLTSPLRKLTNSFSHVEANQFETMESIDIGYRKPDEIGILIGGINALTTTLKQHLLTERALRERTEALERRFRLIFEQASAGIGLLSADNRLQTINPALKALFENIQEGDYFAPLFVDVKQVEDTLEQMRTQDPFAQTSLDLEYTYAGETRWLHCLFAKVTEQRLNQRPEQGSLIEVIAYDITERKRRERETRFEADHDSLTHLRNRRSGERALKQLLSSALKRRQRFVLMMIDLDKFKPVNDTYGHDVGDAVLTIVSQRIKQFFDDQQDVCIRWGGDEFVAGTVTSATDQEALRELAKQLLDALKTPIVVSSSITCQIGGSIGIVIAPEHGDTLEALIALADETMYQVKQRGRNQFIIAAQTLNV